MAVEAPLRLNMRRAQRRDMRCKSEEQVSVCIEIEWKGSRVFRHKGGIQEWKPVVENPRVAAVRKLHDVDFGEWTGIYEVDRVIRETGGREIAQYLVAWNLTLSTVPNAAK